PNCLFLSDTDEDKFFQEKFEKVRSGQKLSPVELMRLFTLHKIGSNNIKDETLINTLDLFLGNFYFLDQKTGVTFYCFLALYLSDDLNDEQRKLFIKRGPEVLSAFENYENNLIKETTEKVLAEAEAKADAKVQAARTNILIKFVRHLKESNVSNESILQKTGLSKEELAEIENEINLQNQ
ncbi:MAG: hypothetical protein LBS60_09860, partial [Deltaproteobacteria bacterium]|nr:hypothetical protein [Deltaproteobacteria bacterium]